MEPLVQYSRNQVQDELARLLAGSLEFHSESSTYASHSLHAFAAKFPPQLPQVFIKHLTSEGETVLDPMVGSGTAIVEACLLGRRAIGFDIDPLAIQICRVKTMPLSLSSVIEAGEKVLKKAEQYLAAPRAIRAFLERFPEENRKFMDYWFAPQTQKELAALLLAIEEEPNTRIKDFLQLLFSSIIITKSGGVSLARDLAHSRPHRDPQKAPRNAIERYQARLLKSIKGVQELHFRNNGIMVKLADCRKLPLDDESVQLVVTSPPYANAIDYMRAHKFSLVWLGQPLNSLSKLRSEYIGAEKVGCLDDIPFPRKTQHTILTLGAKDKRKAAILRKYFIDMRSAMAEMYRVLLPERAAIIVVGPSTMRGLKINTPVCLGEIGGQLGFRLIGIKKRKLDRNRRMMPARFRNNGQSVIEERMHEEHVIGLIKG